MTPSAETLDAICVLITGDDNALFVKVTDPFKRTEIIKLALQAETNGILEGIEIQLGHVGHWFELSRLYEP